MRAVLWSCMQMRQIDKILKKRFFLWGGGLGRALSLSLLLFVLLSLSVFFLPFFLFSFSAFFRPET